MKNPFFLSLLFLAVIAGGAALFLNAKDVLQNSPGNLRLAIGQASPEQLKADYTVELREKGYEPKELVVRQGDTVRFITTRDRHFWPASNLHPSHTIYPAFDPREPIAPQDSWSFTFKKAGTWRYHDHLTPYFTGVIEVRE